MFLYLYFGFRKMGLPEHNRKVNMNPSYGAYLYFYVNTHSNLQANVIVHKVLNNFLCIFF